MNTRLSDLAAQLEVHRPVDAQEKQHLARMLALCGSPTDPQSSTLGSALASVGDPCSRRHFVPGHFTASAFVLSPDGGALLLIFHQKLERWLQPGGHIDDGDPSVLAAARRELHEEVGLCDLPLAHEALFDLDVHDIPSLRGDPPHAHFDLRFLFRARDLHFAAGSDAAAGRWFPLAEISETTSDRSVLRAVEKLRRGTLS